MLLVRDQLGDAAAEFLLVKTFRRLPNLNPDVCDLVALPLAHRDEELQHLLLEEKGNAAIPMSSSATLQSSVMKTFRDAGPHGRGHPRGSV